MTGAVGMVLWLALMTSAAADARGASPTSEERVRSAAHRAATLVREGRYEAALQVLDDAEREDRDPVFIYVRAMVEERRGDCDRAVAGYRQFLNLDVPPQEAHDARAGIVRCGEVPPAVVDDAPVAEPASAPTEEAPPATAAPAPTDQPRRWYADPLGGVLLGGGVVGVGTGVGLLVQARVDSRGSTNASTLPEYERRSDRAVVFNRAGIITLGVGGALIAGAIVRYAIVGRRQKRRVQPTVTVGPGHAGWAVVGRF
ncbi:MAG: hypothetical protein K0V04_26855 [Deltaproteobacteria bacterium]|nr:hypothetical protein [Deltaproteobacteria bacterium]